MGSWKRIVCLALLSVAGLAPAGRADLLHLGEDRWVEGHIVREEKDRVVMVTPRGRKTFARSAVAKVVRGRIIHDLYRERHEALDRKDVSGRLALADWVEKHGYRRAAREQRGFVVAVDPDNETARRKLGHVLHEGAWYRSAYALKRARGYVRVSGTWMAPDDFALRRKRKQVVRFAAEWFRASDARELRAGNPVKLPDASGFAVWRSPHYLFCSALPRFGRRQVRLFERAHEALAEHFGGAPANLLPVVLLGKPGLGDYLADNREPWIPIGTIPHGLFHPGSRTVYADGRTSPAQTVSILLHELCHQFEYCLHPKATPPLWYREGLACFFSGHEREDDGRWRVGRLAPGSNLHFLHLGKLLVAGKSWPLADVLAPGPEKTVDPHWYDHAWSLVYFLLEGAEPALRKGFRAWEKAVHEQGAAPDLFARLGTTRNRLEMEWKAYWEGKIRERGK